MLDQLQPWLVDKGKGALWNLTNGGSGLDRLERISVKLHVLFQTVKPSGRKICYDNTYSLYFYVMSFKRPVLMKHSNAYFKLFKMVFGAFRER